MPDGSPPDTSSARGLFDRLPPHILGGLTAEQKAAIAVAAREPGWSSHRVNIRISLPLPSGRWYFTLVGGPERRTAERRRIERIRHPLPTEGNFNFALIVLGALTLYAAAVAMLATSGMFGH